MVQASKMELGGHCGCGFRTCSCISENLTLLNCIRLKDTTSCSQNNVRWQLAAANLWSQGEVKVKLAQLCLTLYNPMDYTVHGILQARIPEWVALPFSRGFSQPGDRTEVSHCGQILYQLSHQGSPGILECVAFPFSRGSSQPRD